MPRASRSIQLRVLPGNRVVHVPPGANLLESLRGAQVPMSYSCLSGRCGTCRCRVLSGDVLDGGGEQQRPMDGMEGAVLACQTYVTEPCTIEVPEPEGVVVHPARIVKAQVVAVETLAPQVRRLLLRPARPLAFTPGQYAQLAFTPELARPYSLAGLPDDELLEFHVQLLPGGRGGAYIDTRLRAGDTVRVSGPLGAAYLRAHHAGPMLCVAGGTGLAPALSIIKGMLAAGMDNPIHLYFGVRSQRDLYGLEWLAALCARYPALRVHQVVAAGTNPATQRSGLVTQAIAQDHASLRGWRAYLYGSPSMVEATTRLVLGKGMDAAQVHADAYYPQDR